jgi:lipid-binding SYLF domain-containing protein
MTTHVPGGRWLAAAIVCLMAWQPAHAAKSPDEERAEIRETSAKVLERLYEIEPGAREAIAEAAGYAVFSNFGTKILVVGGGAGKGLAVDRKTGAATFMKMVELQTGLGFGVKKFQLVWVFATKSALDGFVDSGWEFGGQVTAAAQYEGEGAATQGALSVSPGVWLYQLTEDGLALELTVKGTKYYRDDDLN